MVLGCMHGRKERFRLSIHSRRKGKGGKMARTGTWMANETSSEASIQAKQCITFIRTVSVSRSRLTILMATFLPVTQCTPNLTSPTMYIHAHITQVLQLLISTNCQVNQLKSVLISGMMAVSFPSILCPSKSCHRIVGHPTRHIQQTRRNV